MVFVFIFFFWKENQSLKVCVCFSRFLGGNSWLVVMFLIVYLFFFYIIVKQIHSGLISFLILNFSSKSFPFCFIFICLSPSYFNRHWSSSDSVPGLSFFLYKHCLILEERKKKTIKLERISSVKILMKPVLTILRLRFSVYIFALYKWIS